MYTENNWAQMAAMGAAGELLAAADLALRGFEIYRGVIGREAFDLVAVKAGRCYRVEVKTGALFSYPVGETQRCDLWAIVSVKDRAVAYSGTPEAMAALSANGQRVPISEPKRQDQTDLIAKCREKCIAVMTPGVSYSVYDVSERANLDRARVQTALYLMVKDGKAIREKRGRAFAYKLLAENPS